MVMLGLKGKGAQLVKGVKIVRCLKCFVLINGYKRGINGCGRWII